MEIKLIPISQNRYPLNGIVIKSDKVEYWLQEIQRMNFKLPQIKVFPLPGNVANSVWGCLIIYSGNFEKDLLEQHNFCQQMSDFLFIAEKTDLFPKMLPSELKTLLGTNYWFVHPDIGFCELTEITDWSSYFSFAQKQEKPPLKPEKGNFIPSDVKSLNIKPVEKEDVMQKMEERYWSEKLDIPSGELSVFEQTRLFIYKNTLDKISKSKLPGGQKYMSENNNIFNRFFNSFNKQINKLADYILEDKEKLEERNKKEMDRLLEMFNSNPLEALKYAIPLGSEAMRGKEVHKLNLTKRWDLFNLLNNDKDGKAPGGFIDIGDYYNNQLQEQYTKTAESLIEKKEFEKAAFVYIKLLNNYWDAAATFKKGGMYKEAASLYLNKMNNKIQAAETYEEGNMLFDAIELYKQLEEYEKVAELFYRMKNYEEGSKYYQKKVDSLVQRHQYYDAGEIYINKMKRMDLARNMYWQGWEHGDYEGEICLKSYFSTFDKGQLKLQLEKVYRKIDTYSQAAKFLKVLQTDVFKNKELDANIREIAYQIAVSYGQNNPKIIKELRFFSPDNKNIIKDVNVFSQQLLRLR